MTRALAVDVGTGTQDVLLFDSEREIENAIRLVLPSPTVIVADQIRRGTRAGWRIVLSGSSMGGGPCHWAARDHAAAGLPICATREAARTFDDDLDVARSMGIRLIDDDEAAVLAEQTRTLHIAMSDVSLDALARALGAFNVDLRDIDAVCVAVFDHGAAPTGVSDRRFRFERLEERLLAEPDAGPAAFAYRATDVPAVFTRLRAATDTTASWLGAATAAPVLAMDTAAAAVLGMLDDTIVAAALRAGRPVVAVNVGNFHTLAMLLTGTDGAGVGGAPVASRIHAILEHHTGELTGPALAALIRGLIDGSVTNDGVFGSMGHGAFRLPGVGAADDPLVAVTGPRRSLLVGTPDHGLGPLHLAAPHADMMQTGCFGLLRALAHRYPAWREPVEQRLGLQGGT